MNKRDKRDTKHKSEKKAKVRDSSPEEERFPAENEEEKENPPPENETNDEKISLFMVDFNQCDPSKCSGRKLESFGLLKNINHKGRFRGITLAATGKKYVSKEDKEIILKHGLCVIDCSWNKIEQLKVKTQFDNERILPFMIAVNPINFGAPYKLSCAEALAAALFICDYWDQGLALMEKFKWGPNFLTQNKEVFELYENCQTYEELKIAEQQYIEQALKEKQEARNKRMLPPSSSESEEEEEEKEDDDNEDKNNNEIKGSPSETKEQIKIEKSQEMKVQE